MNESIRRAIDKAYEAQKLLTPEERRRIWDELYYQAALRWSKISKFYIVVRRAKIRRRY